MRVVGIQSNGAAVEFRQDSTDALTEGRHLQAKRYHLKNYSTCSLEEVHSVARDSVVPRLSGLDSFHTHIIVPVLVAAQQQQPSNSVPDNRAAAQQAGQYCCRSYHCLSCSVTPSFLVSFPTAHPLSRSNPLQFTLNLGQRIFIKCNITSTLRLSVPQNKARINYLVWNSKWRWTMFGISSMLAILKGKSEPTVWMLQVAYSASEETRNSTKLPWKCQWKPVMKLCGSATILTLKEQPLRVKQESLCWYPPFHLILCCFSLIRYKIYMSCNTNSGMVIAGNPIWMRFVICCLFSLGFAFTLELLVDSTNNGAQLDLQWGDGKVIDRSEETCIRIWWVIFRYIDLSQRFSHLAG